MATDFFLTSRIICNQVHDLWHTKIIIYANNVYHKLVFCAHIDESCIIIIIILLKLQHRHPPVYTLPPGIHVELRGYIMRLLFFNRDKSVSQIARMHIWYTFQNSIKDFKWKKMIKVDEDYWIIDISQAIKHLLQKPVILFCVQNVLLLQVRQQLRLATRTW